MEIAVKETYAHMLKDESLVQNAETLYIVEFLFDKSWDGYTKTAIFKAGSVELSVKLTDDRCIIPAECWTPPDDPEHPGNTATDEEVEDVLDDVFGDEP